MRKNFAGLLVGASLVALAGPVLAQDVPAAEADRIVVTGSRTVVNGNDSPTPVTVVSVEASEEVNPGNVADQLNDLPQFSGSLSQSTRMEAGSANLGAPNSQAAVLNLRNFGTTRNLVLFDGHRVASNSPNGTVDINMIPQMLLQRVDVVTGGASAVYGSDAVTGVINFVTDTRFEGIKLHAQAGVSNEGDGESYDAGVAWGGSLGDRLHLLASYQYRREDGIDSRQDREWGRQRYILGNQGAINGVATYRLISSAGRPGASFGGTVSSIGTPNNPFAAQYFVSPNVLAPVTGDQVNGNQAGNSTGSYFEPSLRGSLEMHQAFARAEYEFSDNLSFSVRGAYTNNENGGFAISNPTAQASNNSNIHAIFVNDPATGARNPLITNDNFYNTLNGLGITRFGINKVHGGPGMQDYRQYTQSFGENWSVDAAFNGSFGDTWRWEVALIHSSSDLSVRQNNAMNGRKLGAALDVVRPAGGGTPVCYVTTILSTLPTAVQDVYRGCVPYTSIFGPTITDAEADYIFDPLTVRTESQMTDFEAFIAGSPFDTWAGPVNIALSAQARRQSYEVTPSTTPATLANPLNCAGLRLVTCNATSIEYFQGESLARPRIAVNVREAALEASVPLLADIPLVEQFTLSGAYRLTHYSTSGSISSWKVGADWDVTSDLSFRATRSRDIRAPTMHELYSPESIGSYSGIDPLLNVPLDGGTTNGVTRPNPAGVVRSGNADLRPELSDTFTLGMVYAPDWAPGLSIAVDYFDIKVKDAIITFDGGVNTTQIDCIRSGGTSPTCDLIVRTVDCCTTTSFNNAITRVFARPINIGQQYTRGVDFETNYRGDIGSRPFNLRLLVSYQPKNVLVDAITGIQTNNAGAGAGSLDGLGHPKWRGTLVASMEVTDNLRVAVQERYRGPMSWFPTYTGTGAPQFAISSGPENIPARFYTNLNVTYSVGPADLFVNVQNLFNQDPAIFASPNAPFAGLNGVAPGDDGLGRYFTAGVRARF